MNKYIYFLTITVSINCTMIFKANAQQNTSFELWSNKGLYYDLNNWSTFNLFAQLGGNISCIKTNGQINGTSAIRLTSAKIPDIDTLAGVILQKEKALEIFNSFEVLYRYAGNKEDSASINVFYFKDRVNPSNLVGSGNINFQPSVGWNKTSVDIYWENTNVPDSIVIMVSTSSKNFFDTLYIDYINFSKYKLDINKNQDIQTSVYFNYINKQLVLSESNTHTAQIKLYNNHGQLIKVDKLNAQTFDLSFLSSGIYYYEIEYISGRSIKNKLIIPE